MAEKLFNLGGGGPFATKEDQAGPIYVNNATVLGYSQEVQYFGSDIGFSKTVSINIQCVVTDITNSSGASVASKNLMGFLSNSQDYSEVILNGRPMGPAKVVGFSLDSADMVNSASCSVSFLIHETYDNLSSLSASTYYKDYGGSLPISDFGQILDSFSDSISLSRGNNEMSYSRNISIAANKSLNIKKLGDVIKEFVRGVLGFATFSFPDFSSVETDINELANPTNNFKKFITETVDDTSNTYTFQESLNAGNYPLDIEGDYSLVVSDTYSRDQNGIETVTENGAIIGLTYPRIDAAEAGYATELGNADARMKNFYAARRLSPSCPDLNTDGSGNLIFFTKGKTTNTFEGTINYTLASNNDPTYKDGNGEKWEYTITVDSDGVYESATEQGTVNGKGNVKYDGTKTGLDRYTKYQTAKTFLMDEVFPGMNGRIAPLINSGTFAVSPQPTRRTESHAPRQGVITYSRSFSNNPIYQKNGPSNRIKKLTASSTLRSTVPITHEFVALAPAAERKIVQEQSTEALSTSSSTITAVGYRINPSREKSQLSRIGNIAKDEINLVSQMDGDTDYMGTAGFSFAPLNDVIFTLNTSYNGGIGSC